MSKQRQVVERNGHVWVISRLAREEAQERDFQHWHEGLTPEQRVEMVELALESCLKTRPGCRTSQPPGTTESTPASD